MSKETAVIVLGLWVLVMPFLGIPRTWLTAFMVATALLLMVLGFLLRAETLSRGARNGGRHHTFVEHMPEEDSGTHHADHHDRKERLSSLN